MNQITYEGKHNSKKGCVSDGVDSQKRKSLTIRKLELLLLLTGNDFDLADLWYLHLCSAN